MSLQPTALLVLRCGFRQRLLPNVGDDKKALAHFVVAELWQE